VCRLVRAWLEDLAGAGDNTGGGAREQPRGARLTGR
jgi:hypothetical protein